jgi:hypothetical protein
MSVYENIMRGLTEAVEYQHGTLEVRETTLSAEGEDVVTLGVQYLNKHSNAEVAEAAVVDVSVIC